MTIARAIRVLLVGVTLLVIAWSFADVGRRAIRRAAVGRDRPVSLTILHWGDPRENAIVQGLVDRYERDHPNVRIQRIQASDFDSKLKTMMAAGTPPDLFYLPPRLLPQLADLKLIEPIDAYVERDVRTNGRAWFDDYFPVLLDTYRYDASSRSTGRGALYGLPKDFTTLLFYVNVDLFRAAGLDVAEIQRAGWTWAQFEDAMRRVRDLTGKPGYEGRTLYGGVLELWPDTLRQVVWHFGGDFFGPSGFRDVALDQPSAQRALDMIARLRLTDRTVFNSTGIAKDGGQEFINGNIGVDGPVGRWKVPTFNSISRFKWDVLPMPADRPEYRASQIIATAWTMSSGSAQKDEAFALMKFLSGGAGAIEQSRLGLAIPPLRSVALSDDFLKPDGLHPHHARLFLDAIDHARLQRNPSENEWERLLGDNITEAIQLGTATPLAAARRIAEQWNAELDSPLRRSQHGRLRWTPIVAATLGLLATLICAFWWRARRERLGSLDRAQQRAGLAFIAPWLLGFLLLTAGPMLVSLLLSFSRWSGLNSLDMAESVGVANYQQLLTGDPTFYQSLRVTMYYVLLAVPLGQVLALAVALLMNSDVRGIVIFRTIYFVPSVVSGAALSVLWLQIYNNDYGVMNEAIRRATVPRTAFLIGGGLLVASSVAWSFLHRRRDKHQAGTLVLAGLGAGLFAAAVFIGGDRTGLTPPDWFGRDAPRWAIPGFVIMGIWGVGSGMILYLAGLKGVPQSLYEAAYIDGAGAGRRLFSITIPMLSPLIFYNLVMGLIGAFQTFTQAYVMTGAGPGNATLFYVLNLYRQAFEFHNMGYASAMAWVLFVLCLLLTALVFRGSKNLVYYEGAKA